MFELDLFMDFAVCMQKNIEPKMFNLNLSCLIYINLKYAIDETKVLYMLNMKIKWNELYFNISFFPSDACFSTFLCIFYNFENSQ